MNGKTIKEEILDEEDKRIMKEAEWQGTKSEIIYDFEQKDVDFGRVKATKMKNNKRIRLPQASSHPDGSSVGGQKEGCL